MIYHSDMLGVIKMNRQKLRKIILIFMLLLFPITIWYFSPYLIIMGALDGVINGSFILFSVLFISSVLFGRIFCGFLCPMGGLQDCLIPINEKVPRQGWRNNIKYVIWIVWVALIIISFINRKGTVNINFLYMTDHGISVSNIYCYIIYYGVIFLISIPSILFGKRLFCHYFCWMAPFVVLGTKIGIALHSPILHIEADKDKCISCKKCNEKCSMGIDVWKMVETGKYSNNECIQCGECVDICPRKVLKYSMNRKMRF